MTYTVLPEQLRSTADKAASFFETRWGVKTFEIEAPFHADIAYRPTLHAVTSDYHDLCVEVSESPYPSVMDSLVVDCITRCLPIRLVVALPAGSQNQYYSRDLERARECGVGTLEVSTGNSKLINQPLSLSLAGLRPIDLEKFPRKYRLSLSSAEDTFKRTHPAKGCSLLYDEIEDLSRKVAAKTEAKGFWRIPKPKMLNFDTSHWHRVMRFFMQNLDTQRCKCISDGLLGRILGITSHRNDAAHKPKSKAALLQRDRQLRTRFENATDILSDLIASSKSLHV